MKREVSFFKDRRGGFTAKNLIAAMKMVGMTDAQIKEEMLRIKAKHILDAEQESSKSQQEPSAEQ